MITQADLRKLLSYSSETGLFTWLDGRNIGKIAGRVSNNGYVIISIMGHHYLAHRLVWLYATGSFPKLEIDHSNRNRADNRLCNLREASSSENKRNRPARAKSGYKGVTLQPDGKGFQARIRISGICNCLGTRQTAYEASLLYNAAVERVSPLFACTGSLVSPTY